MASRRSEFLIGVGDLPPGAPDVFVSDDSVVSHLLDAQNYFHALRAEVDWLKDPKNKDVPGKVFHVAGWTATWLTLLAGDKVVIEEPSDAGRLGKWLAKQGALQGPGTLKTPKGTEWTYQIAPGDAATAFKLDDLAAGAKYVAFVDELYAMHQNGVDVRVLLWVNPLLLTTRTVKDGGKLPDDAAGLRWNNVFNVQSVRALRSKAFVMREKVSLFTVSHPLGALHPKMAICGVKDDARAFVGGLDLAAWRLDTQAHPKSSTFHWHDVVMSLGGGAVRAINDYFAALWKEQHEREVVELVIDGKVVPSHVRGAPKVARVESKTKGASTVQVLRTCPRMNVVADPEKTPPTSKAIPLGVAERGMLELVVSPWSFAPRGIFEVEAALKKAIGAAKRFIYAEDQGFQSWEIMSWLRSAILANPLLKVVLVQKADPSDGPGALVATTTSINQNLCTPALPAGRDLNGQVAYFRRADLVTIHAKTWIIDDVYAIAGSANASRRSMSTDAELSVGIFDEGPSVSNVVSRYRADLWAEHCGLPILAANKDLRAQFLDANRGIKAWVPEWSLPGSPSGIVAPWAKRVPELKREKLPFPSPKAPVTSDGRDRDDADSRNSV